MELGAEGMSPALWGYWVKCGAGSSDGALAMNWGTVLSGGELGFGVSASLILAIWFALASWSGRCADVRMEAEAVKALFAASAGLSGLSS